MCASNRVRPIPEDTESAGKALFQKGSFYKTVGDQLDELCRDCDREEGSTVAEPQIRIPILYLVTIFQYLESMSDSQAAAAVLNRVDWKYALHLPLVSLGFDQKGLADYHRRLLADPTVLKCLNELLERVRCLYETPAPGTATKMNTAQMLEAVHVLNRLSQIVRAMRLALDELALYHPEWLKKTVLPHWFQRYARTGAEGRHPETSEKRESLAMAVAADGFFLLDALDREDAPGEARDLPEVEYFRHVWSRHFERSDTQVRWRTTGPRRTGRARGRIGP